MKEKIKKSILKVKPYVPGKPIEEVKRDSGLKRVIKLASNENPYPPSPKVIKAIEKAATTVNRYPYSDCYYLKDALVKKLGVSSSQLIFGNGSDEIILLAVRAFVQPGDEVVLAKPSFLMYSIDAQIEGAVIKSIPVKNYQYDLQAMKRAVTPITKLIFLGNPDNPVGTYFTDQDVRSFLKGLRKDILILLDEAYFEYVEQKDYVDSIKLLSEYPNIIVTRTFSKMYGLAGLRVGYGISSAEVIDFLNRIRDPFNVNSVAQAAALACLKDKSYYRQIATDIRQQRAYIYQELTKMGLQYVRTYTNFIIVHIAEADKYVEFLLHRGVIVRSMSAWGLQNCFRLSIGTQAENRQFINILKRALKDIKEHKL
ncbi:MAG: histidinol-phosphate transaminase [Candidatus Omnitrophica bacterium]|nr:histidinol-phosphate transaminase [Candidatus Omnitrophota bacterium]